MVPRHRSLTLITEVFGLTPDDPMLEPLLVPEAAAHLEVVGEMALEMRDYLFHDRHWTPERTQRMKAWLLTGSFKIDGVVHRTAEVLTDEQVAQRAYGDLVRVTC
jgi:hypothetical protein